MRTLGRYTLERVLGKGAMGIVYEGIDPRLNRRVAIKTIRKSNLDDDAAKDFGARFVREAQAVARLNHPNIVQIHDFGEEADVAYIVMEFIKGKELKSFFDANQRFRLEDAVRIMGELCDALDFAHQAGIIHRDVKPQNVMLDSQARVKLTDFGVARVQDQGHVHTTQGTMVGTPAYMSPEQISGARVDRRTDVFSAGIILYQFLAGDMPFTGNGAWTVAKKIMQEHPPLPSSLNTSVTPLFDAVVNKALAKDPGRRYQTAREFGAALKRALEGKPEEDDPDRTVVSPMADMGALAKPAAQMATSKVEATKAATSAGSQEVELEFWRAIKDGNDPDDFELYVQQFPTGIYAALAKRKIAKLRGVAPEDTGAKAKEQENKEAEDAANREGEVKEKLADEKAKLEATLVQREAEYRKREAETEARRLAEEKARLEAMEKAKREAAAELAKRDAEYKRREAEARVKAEALRREAEETAKLEAVAKAKAEVEAKARREAEFANREAELKRRERAAAVAATLAPGAPRKNAAIIPIVIGALVAAVVGASWFAFAPRKVDERVAVLEKQIEEAMKLDAELRQVRARETQAIKELELARQREAEAKKSGDVAKQNELAEARLKAEAEAKKQAELAKKSEADSKKQSEAAEKAKVEQARIAEAKNQTEAQQRVAQERAAAEKAAAEKAAAEKGAAEKAAAERAAAEQKAAAEKAAAKTGQPSPPAAAIGGLPAVGDTWVYRYTDLWKPSEAMQITHKVTAISNSAITENLSRQGAAAISVFSPVASKVHQWTLGPASITEFSPFAMASGLLKQGQSFKPLAHNSTWSVSASVQGEEEISVPAGRFRATKVVLHGTNSETFRGVAPQSALARFEMTVWYAPELKRYIKSTYFSFNYSEVRHDRSVYELVSAAPPR